ncbi:MAG: PKD domain-containing protein [Ferruginibacter sp.]|nr:PKD domain-containing protein [Ferruginibacter sp.]
MNKYLLFILLMAMSCLVEAQTTDFTYQNSNSNACLPIEILFSQTSTDAPVGYLWDFGNGSRSNSANPVATYSTAGYYTVRLITVYANSTAQKTRTVLVQPSISATFTSDKNYLCQPGTVIFTASVSGNLGRYEWDFGDATPHIEGTLNALPHTFTGYGNFTVKLTATSITGCSVIHTENIRIERPGITGSINSPILGCVPMIADFNAAVSVPPGSSVSNYMWDFGDGNFSNGISAQLTHNYTQVGSFSPALTITTSDGCTNTFRFDSLAYGRPPTNHIAYPIDLVYCGSETPQFVATANTANRYDWDFGGGAITSVTDTFVEHRYSSLGQKNITVTPAFNGCPGTAVNFQIDIIGVIARYSYNNTCIDKKTFLFNNTSQGNISTINWSLGNQAYSTNPDTVSHTYPASGVFATKLLISDNITGCVDSFKTRIYTAKPVMQNPDQSICINTSTQFTVVNNYTNPALTYLWHVVGLEIGPNTEASPAVTADTLGHFTNQFVVLYNGVQYCPDTIRLDHPITVRGPKIDFTAPASICLNTPLAVVNLSQPFQSADSIRSWNWSFGIAGANNTAFQPQPYTYSTAKAYNVKLTAIDIYGCQDSLVKKVYVRPIPFLWIIPKLVTLCEGQSSTLIGYTSDQILWSSANINFCTTCDTTTLSPVVTTKYYATSTNSFNCASTDSAIVKVFNPFTANPLTPDTAFCGGGKVRLDMEPKHKVITWVPSTGLSNNTIYDPVAAPSRGTIYTATLTDSAGCFTSAANISISVKSTPTINAGPDKVYPYNTNFTFSPIYSSNTSSWLWSPADSLSCSTCPFPVGTAASTKTYSIKVVSDSGCLAQDNITIFVECKGANLLMPAAFTPNNDNLNDLYFPLTRGIKGIKRFSIYNRQGQLVFEMRDFSPNKERFGWDGRSHGQNQEVGAYVYFVEAVCDLGLTLFSKGSFILVR